MRARDLILVAALAVAASTGVARAQTAVPPAMAGVEIVEHLGDGIPLDVAVTDHLGQERRLGDLISGERPVILVLGYYRCPMLCGLVLGGLTESLAKLDRRPGVDYDLVALSIDPDEGSTLAAGKRASVLEALGLDEGAAGISVLTGPQPTIDAVAGAAGFGFRKDPRSGQYVHGAVIMVTTPTGELARYLYGVSYAPRDLELAMLEAGRGEIGASVTDRILMFCYRYDPDAGSYALVAVRVMQLGGALTVLTLGSFLGLMWIRERRTLETNREA